MFLPLLIGAVVAVIVASVLFNITTCLNVECFAVQLDFLKEI